MDSNQSGAVGETIWDPFQGSLTHLGASGRLQSQIQAIPGQILTFPDPPCQLSQLKWSKMACTGAPQIVLHISYSTRTYWRHFRPCKVSFSALAERSSLLLRQCEFWKYCFRGTKTQNFPGSNFLRAKTFRTKCAKPFLTTSLKSALLPLTTLPKNA